MLVLKYNNSVQNLGDVVHTATTFNVAPFTGTDYISTADFVNTSNTTITVPEYTQSQSMYIGSAFGNMFSGGPVDGEIAPFYLLVHPTQIITAQGTTSEYKYDGCRFQCYATQGGSGHLMGYDQNNLTYDFQPKFAYIHGQGGELPSTDNIPVNRINGVTWVGVFNDKTCTALRPLYSINMAGVTGYTAAGTSTQFFFGPLVPSTTVKEWFKDIRQQDDPDDPDDDPDDGDSQDAEAPEGVNWTWLNQFTIMNWDGAWPNKLLVDTGDVIDPSVDYWHFHYNDYLAYNDNNDPTNKYHWYGTTFDIAYYDDMDICVNNIEQLHTLGSNLFRYAEATADSGYFIKIYPPAGTTEKPFWTSAEAGTFIVNENMTISINSYPNIRGLTITNNGSTFNFRTNYPNFRHPEFIIGSTNAGLCCHDLCIIRYQNHYYLGGIIALCRPENMSARSGFAVLCRIDELKSMPNYGGSNPEDPDNVTGDGINPEDTFGDGPGYGSNPSTDKDVDNYTGDGTLPIDPGATGSNTGPGYYDPDGTYHSPDGTVYGPDDPENPRNKGTGEKQSNPIDISSNPNTHDGSVGNGTGNPHQNDTQITNPSTTLPSGGSTGTIGGAGFLSIFTPTQAELTSFSGELFSTTALTAIKQYFSSNPMDGIFGLHMVPFTGFASGVTANPRIGTYDFSTALTLAGDEFINVDYGEIEIPFVYDGYENFAPQSDAKIFLPFIGTKDIDINVIQGCKIHLYYNVSLVTGDIYAYLYCQWNSKYQQFGVDQGVDHLMYHWQGNCAVSIPISHVDSSNYISGAMQIAGGITSLAAGAVAGSPFTIPSGITGVTQGIAEMGRSSIITSGNISGVAAFMGAREPYLILSRPIIAYNESYNHYLGRKSNAIARIGVLNEGTYTVMRNVDLSGVSATSDELQQIDGILKGGFYV